MFGTGRPFDIIRNKNQLIFMYDITWTSDKRSKDSKACREKGGPLAEKGITRAALSTKTVKNQAISYLEQALVCHRFGR